MLHKGTAAASDSGEEPLAEVLSRFDLEASILRSFRVHIRSPKLGRGFHNPLDGIREILVEEAGRDHFAGAGEPFPANVDIVDEGSPEVGISDHGTPTHDIRELKGG